MHFSQPLKVLCCSKHLMKSPHVAKLPRGSMPHMLLVRLMKPLLLVLSPYT